MEHQLLQIFEDWPFNTTLWRLLWRSDSIRSRRLLVIPLFFSLYRSPSCQTLTNAFDKSKKTSRTSNGRLASDALKILWVIERSWSTQESFGLKLDWVLLSRLFFIMNSKIASKTSFSKIASKTSFSETLEHIRYKAIVTENFVDYLSYVL